MPLPSELLEAVSSHGGQVVVVVGAGCSAEPPTSLPLSRECSLEAYRRLIADGVLRDGLCGNPEDLSLVADAVFDATGAQVQLVRRLPVARFRNATPNRGHLLAAAMLRERALGSVMILNFDLALSHALPMLGAGDEIAIVNGLGDSGKQKDLNLIYVHRNVDSDPEEWVLRSAALREGWKGKWEELASTVVLASPVVVFVGLGSPARVLIDTASRIRGIVRDKPIFHVDVVPREESSFFRELNLRDESYIRMGWLDFMETLARRVVDEHRADLEEKCGSLIQAEGWHTEDSAGVCRRLTSGGLLLLGAVRARWLLDDSPYLPRHRSDQRLIADQLTVVALIERVTGSTARFSEDGVVEFRQDERIIGSVLMASGGGVLRWLRLETVVYRDHRTWGRHDPRPSSVVVSAVPGGREYAVAPTDITGEEESGSIVTAAREIRWVTVDDLRMSEAAVRGLF